MDKGTGGEAQEAIQTVAEAVGQTASLEAQLEAAEAATEAAEEAAEAIAEAAMEAERMRVVEQIRKDAETWRDALTLQIGNLQTELAQLAATLAEAITKMSQPPEVKVEVTPKPATETLLTPSASPEAPATTVTVNPDESAADLPAPAAPEKARRHRWL